MLKGNGLLDHLMVLGPYFGEIFGRDLVVWISDTDNVLGYFPGKNFDVGSDGILAADDPMRAAMQKAETMQLSMPAGILGIPWKEIDNPVFDDKGNVVGCISFGISLKQETKVVDVSHSINEAVDNMDASVREFADSAENVRNSEKVLRDNIDEVNALTKEISNVLSFTKRIADQTNLLGLNASIEAARAGTTGAGFGVVAEEIRQLAIESMSFARKIEVMLVKINEANKMTLEYSDSAYAATEGQVVEIEKTRAKIQELKNISDELIELSKEI